MRKLMTLLMIAGAACLLYGLYQILPGVSLLADPAGEALGMGMIRRGVPWAASGFVLALCAWILRRRR